MTLHRRAVLASAAALSGGCLGLGGAGTPTPTSRPDRDGDGVPDGADDYPTDERRAFRSSRSAGSPTLQPGEFRAVALTNHPQEHGEFLHYEAEVAGDTGVDCLVFERDAYDAYADGQRDVPVVDRYSRTDVTEASVTVQLDRGEYLFALDYTEQATPPGRSGVTVEYVVELAEPVERPD